MTVLGPALLALAWAVVPLAAQEARPAEEPPAERTYPAWRTRLYPVGSAAAWSSLRAVLKKQGIRIGESDQKAQVLVTAETRFDPDTGPSAPVLDGRYRPRTFRLHLFVSPFSEPARVHVGSIVEAADQLEPRFTRYVFGLPALHEWLFDRLEEDLGRPGVPMPRGESERKALARLLGTPETPCPDDSRLLPTDSPIAPEPIKVSRFEPIYPGRADSAPGRVKVTATLLEDGAVVDVRPTENTGPSAQYAHSAAEAVRLWRYRPARLGDCPIPIIMTVSVTFRSR